MEAGNAALSPDDTMTAGLSFAGLSFRVWNGPGAKARPRASSTHCGRDKSPLAAAADSQTLVDGSLVLPALTAGGLLLVLFRRRPRLFPARQVRRQIADPGLPMPDRRLRSRDRALRRPRLLR